MMMVMMMKTKVASDIFFKSSGFKDLKKIHKYIVLKLLNVCMLYI